MAAVTLGIAMAAVYGLHVPLPYRDEWASIDHFQRFQEGSYGFSDLASQHNEHRLLFPRLFFFADERWFDLSGYLDATVTVALQASNAALLLFLGTRSMRAPAWRALAAGVVVTWLFTLSQEQNLTNGFQLQFVGVFTAALLAGMAYAGALARLLDGRGRAPALFALSAAGCVVAAYTMANGVLAGFVLAAVAVLRRAPWHIPAATAAASGLLAAAFFHGYVPGEFSLPLSHALTHPFPYLGYAMAYLGNPIGEHLRAAQAMGAIGLALAAGAAWRCLTGRSRDVPDVALLAFAGFVVASASATAYGRITLGVSQAFESRYVTPSMLFWSAMVLFWLPVAAKSRHPRTALCALASLAMTLTVPSLLAEASTWPVLTLRAVALRQVSDSLMAGLYDGTAADTYENMTPTDVAPYVPFLREHHLAAFADPDAVDLGKPVASLSGTVEPQSCKGTVTARSVASLGAGGVALAGTAMANPSRRAPHRIIAADARGYVVGFGSASLPGRPPRLWVGYAKAMPGDVVSAYAKLPDGTLCDLGTATVDAVPPG